MDEIEKPKFDHLLNCRVFFGILFLLSIILVLVWPYLNVIITLLRPKLVPNGAYLNPMLLILSVFGGLALAGFLGVVYGPVIMIIFITTHKLYRTNFLGIVRLEDGNNEVVLSVE